MRDEETAPQVNTEPNHENDACLPARRTCHAERGLVEADAQSAFAKMRSLAGEWRAPLPNDETMIDIFRPIAFGTALLHEEWKNGEQLTATVFYVDNGQLRADHFCDMGNQLRYVDESKDPQVLQFVLRDASNLETHPNHFHSTTWRYVDAEHHVQDWEIAVPGKPSKSIRMNFTRVAAATIEPQAVVRADVQALNDGNAPVLLSLFAADGRIFRTPDDPDHLTGPLSDKMGTQDQRRHSSAKCSRSVRSHGPS